MKPALRLAAVGGGAWLLFLVVLAPAARLQQWWWGDGAPLHGISGTLWAGRAVAAEVAGTRWQGIAWAWRPAALASGALGWAIDGRLGDGRLAGRLELAPGGWRLTGLEGKVPLAALLPGHPLGGSATPFVERLSWDGAGAPVAAGRLLLSGVTAAGLPLGDLLLTLEPAEEGTRVVVADRGGPVAVSGEGRLGEGRSWRLELTLTPRDRSDTALARAVAALGRPGPDGSAHVALKGDY